MSKNKFPIIKKDSVLDKIVNEVLEDTHALDSMKAIIYHAYATGVSKGMEAQRRVYKEAGFIQGKEKQEDLDKCVDCGYVVGVKVCCDDPGCFMAALAVSKKIQNSECPKCGGLLN